MKNSSTSRVMISIENNTRWFMLFVHIRIALIASAVIMLGWLYTQKEERSQKIDNLLVLATCCVWYVSVALK